MILDFPSLQFAFQNPASPISEGIIDLHHAIFHYLLGILIVVLYMFYKILYNSSYIGIFLHLKIFNHLEKHI